MSLNSAFVTYKEMYFEGGVSSVYLWDLEEQQGRELAFAGVVLLKKSKSSLLLPITDERLMIALPNDAEHTGSWDSLHVFECQERGRSAKYKLTSTVMLVLKSKTASKSEGEGGKGKGDVALSGSMTRQVCALSL
jgi:capping protein beta